jgi:hypothetical protein
VSGYLKVEDLGLDRAVAVEVSGDRVLFMDADMELVRAFARTPEAMEAAESGGYERI